MHHELSLYSSRVADLVSQVKASRKGKPWPLESVELEEASFDLLVAALQDSDHRVRRDAAWVLGRMKSVRTVEPLLQYIHDPENLNRGGVVFALGSIGDAVVVKPLMEALHDSEADVRSAAMSMLARRGEAGAVGPFLQAFRRVLSDEEDDPVLRWEIVMWIRRLSQNIDDKTAFASTTGALENLKTDDDQSMRREALKTLDCLEAP